MKKKRIKGRVFWCIIMSLVCWVQPVIASENSYENEICITSQECIANIAYIKNVNETGTNINNELVNGSLYTMPKSNAAIELLNNNTINVSISIADEEIILLGSPIGRTESGKTVFFTGTSNNARYEIVSLAYTTDTSVTNMYFKDTKMKDYYQSNTMLKIYLKDICSDTRDYYFVEIFDVTINYESQFIEMLECNPLLGDWASQEFQPVSEYIGEDLTGIVPMASTSTRYGTCMQTFVMLGEDVRHTIQWRSDIDYSNLIKGQEANMYYRLTVSAQSMIFENSTDLNTDRMSYLEIRGLSLCQTSIPNTAWKSTMIDGNVKDSSLFKNLSASIGVSYGLLSVSYTIPTSFQEIGTIDINDTYTGYINSGQYTRSIKTEMDSDFWLEDIGHYFEVVSVLRHYGNSTAEEQPLRAKWYIDVVNNSTLEHCSHVSTHDVLIDIVA